MTLNEYIVKLQAFVIDNPTSGGYTVVSSADDEGNSYSEAHYDPSIGLYIYDDRDFISAEGLREDGEL